MPKNFSLYQLLENAKKHLSPSIKHDFLFNKKDLSEDQVNQVESHLKECELCTKEISSVEDKKEIYSSLPNLDY